MIDKLEITIDVIVHATEDISKILLAFEETLEINEDEFSQTKTTGHFDNPIIVLNTKCVKKQAQNLMKKILSSLSKDQIKNLIDEIEERTIDSRYHVRLDKQEIIRGRLIFREKDPIKLKIHTPIYNKKDTIKTFTKIFQNSY